jgi:hypothetical protein
MKEEAPLSNPFIGEPRGGRTASPCGQSPSIISQSGVVEVKERVVEEKREKEGGDGRPPPILVGRPSFGLNFPLPFTIRHILIP